MSVLKRKGPQTKATQFASPEEPVAVDDTTEAQEVETAEQKTGPNPDDLSALWAPMTFVDTTINRQEIHAGTRPPKDRFFRIMPFTAADSPSACKNCRSVRMFEYTEPGELSPSTYYVPPNSEAFHALLERNKIIPALLVVGIVYRTNDLFVWELKLPTGKNKSGDAWSRSRLNAATRATTEWLRLVGGAGGYDHEVPTATYENPDWSKVDFDDTLRVACKDRIVSTTDHDALRDYLGL